MDLKKVKDEGLLKERHGLWREVVGEPVDVETVEKYMKKIVFIVFVEWCRKVGERRMPEEEYGEAKSRLPEGTGLYMECSGQGGAERGRQYCAVVVLRAQLATVGDIREWLDLGERWRVLEPVVGRGLAGWVEDVQSYCGRDGSEAHGEPIVVEQGDVETRAMMEGLLVRDSHQLWERGRGHLERLTWMMRKYYA